MTLPRPTHESLGLAAGHLEQLAYAGSDLYPDLALLLDLACWLEGEVEAARNAAAYGSGIAEVHVLGSSSRGVEGRLYDPLLNDLRRMRRSWRSQLACLATELQAEANRAANWPHRSTDTG